MKLLENILTDDNQILNLIKEKTIGNQTSLITYLNQNCFNIYMKDKEYRDLIDNYFTSYMDGLGFYLLLKFLNKRKFKRFNATDLNDKILEQLKNQKLNIYIIGGRFSANQIKIFKQRTEYNLVGYYNGYFQTDELIKIENEINNINPEIIIIGMGVPKQELLAFKLMKKNSCKNHPLCRILSRIYNWRKKKNFTCIEKYRD